MVKRYQENVVLLVCIKIYKWKTLKLQLPKKGNMEPKVEGH